jgi:lipoate-protein ligase A
MSDLIPISRIASPQEEQDWNRAQLAARVEVAKTRFWVYDHAGVVLGCSQKGLVPAAEAMRRAGIALAERDAGGGAVLVGPWMLSSSIVLPVTHPAAKGGALAGFKRIGTAFTSVLRELGIAAEMVTPEHAKQATAEPEWACYGGLSPWEVAVGRRKIVGLAQVRKRNGVLLAAGLLLRAPEWPLLCRAMDRPEADAEALHRHTTSCAQELGYEPALTDIVYGLRRALQEVTSITRFNYSSTQQKETA